MGRRALLLATLMLLPLALAPTAQACVGVPCGRIYPLILIQLDEPANTWNLTTGVPLTVKATLTYKFDMVNEGYTAAAPNEPVEIRFEYPRLPGWATLKVEPEVIPVDVNNPTYVQPDLTEPTNPQGSFSYSVPITITMGQTGQAVLKDGYDFAKLLVFAKSSESGLYQSGYGIKELRVIPENALHESDVAGTRDTFVASPLPALDIAPVERAFAGTTVSLDVSDARFWEPALFTATVSPPPAGRMLFAVHDETGALVASTPAVDASTGQAQLPVTLAQPGRHTATLTLLPNAGSMTPPITYALPFDAGAVTAEGFAYPKTYVVQALEPLPLPLANSADPLAQFERDIPFFVFDSAQSATATLTLLTNAPVDIGRGLANLQFSIHDPDGNMLQAGSVDPTKPTWTLRVGSVPMEGWYVMRLKGLGDPAATRYDARIEVNYAASHEARNHADGRPDDTGGLLARAGANLTLPVDGLAVWAPSDVTPIREGVTGASYTVTIYDANGTLAYASGQRTGASTFSPPAPGSYRAFVSMEPTSGAIPFSPIVRAFTFDVGRGNTSIAKTFAIDDAFEAPFAATDTLLGFHAIRVADIASEFSLSAGVLVDEDGNAAEPNAPGLYYLRVSGRGDPPAGSALPVHFEQSYASAVTMPGPGVGDEPARGGLPIPGIAVALALIAIGILAVGLALARR